VIGQVLAMMVSRNHGDLAEAPFPWDDWSFDEITNAGGPRAGSNRPKPDTDTEGLGAIPSLA
jgi:hypothetical protein